MNVECEKFNSSTAGFPFFLPAPIRAIVGTCIMLLRANPCPVAPQFNVVAQGVFFGFEGEMHVSSIFFCFEKGFTGVSKKHGRTWNAS